MPELTNIESKLFSAREFRLESGQTLPVLELAYETYGSLSPARDNVVLVCHALSGDAHAAGHHGDPTRSGWWDTLIGPGKPVDTDRLFVISSNLLGGCQGTTGPSSVDPATGEPYGLRFPLFTVSDLVKVQRRLLEHLGVTHVLAAIGGSLGGLITAEYSLFDGPGRPRPDYVVLSGAGLLGPEEAIARYDEIGWQVRKVAEEVLGFQDKSNDEYVQFMQMVTFAYMTALAWLAAKNHPAVITYPQVIHLRLIFILGQG